MSKYQPTSSSNDGGKASARPVRRPREARALGNAVGAAVRRVRKTYGSRLPVSGKEPPRLDAHERRRMDERS